MPPTKLFSDVSHLRWGVCVCACVCVGGGGKGGSCHKSQRFKINNHKSQTFQMLQSQSQRMAQRILKSQVTDKLFCNSKIRVFLFGHHRSLIIPLSKVTDLFSAFSQITLHLSAPPPPPPPKLMNVCQLMCHQ